MAWGVGRRWGSEGRESQARARAARAARANLEVEVDMAKLLLVRGLGC